MNDQTRTPGAIRVFLLDDHEIFRRGLRDLLAAESDIVVVGEAATGEEAQALCQELQPDIMVLDLNMPGPPATETVAYVQEHCPQVHVLVLTAYDDEPYIRGLVSAGVSGYILKDEAPDALVQAVRTVVLGGTWFSQSIVRKLTGPRKGGNSGPDLTNRERELLGLLVLGWDNAHIARELNLGEQTVRNYLSRMYAKLGVQTRSETIAWAHEHNMISEP
jgi:DNA-binding NarL/FixJ family response regulator